MAEITQGCEGASEYELEAAKAIHIWKKPELGWSGKAMEFIRWPLDKAGDALMKTPGVGWVIEKSVSGFVNVANDVAQWSVRPDAIYEEFRKQGFEDIRRPADVLSLDLKDVDRVIGWLAAKYKGSALAEGATFGSLGLPGIPPDIVLLVTLNLRAIGEYATYCGFDVSSQGERLFAMNLLGVASSPSDASKAVAMAQLVRIARDVARKKAWKDLQKYAFVKVFNRIAKAVGIRLTKAKLAQVLPVAGGLVGGGFNTYFTAKVCDAAYFLYRERFLAAKWGDDWIETTVAPAPDLDPRYEEADEEIPPDRTPPREAD